MADADRPTALLNDLFDQLGWGPSEVSGVPTEQILKDVSPNEVLILPCGSAKDPASCAMEAYKRYTGPMWGEARKAMGADAPKFLEKAGLDLYILSAEHGLMDAGKLIENYDRELTPERLEEIKGDKTLRETISNTLAQYDPDKIHLGTPKKYTKLITDVMGRDYKSVFPEGSGSGLQKKGIIDYIKSRAQTSKEMVPYEDLDEPTLPMGDGSKKRGGATKPKPLGWGIGSLARKYQPLLQLIQVAQGMWEDLSPEKKEAVTSLMNTPVEDLIGLDTSGLDYYRDLLGILPPGGIMDVANEVPEDYQLDLVEDTDLKKDYVRNTGIGGLFDFDYGKGAMDTAQRQQAARTELYRKQQIMKNAEGPRVLEDLESKERGYQMRRSRSGPYRLETPSDPLFEVGKVDLETHMRLPTKSKRYKWDRYVEETGKDPKIGFESSDPDEEEKYWISQGMIYPRRGPKTNYFIRQIVKDAFKVGELAYQFEVIDVEDGLLQPGPDIDKEVNEKYDDEYIIKEARNRLDIAMDPVNQEEPEWRRDAEQLRKFIKKYTK